MLLSSEVRPAAIAASITRTLGPWGTSAQPSGSVWIKDASPRKYSAELFVYITRTRLPRASILAWSASLTPVAGSTAGRSVNGNRCAITLFRSFEFWPKR